MIPKFKIRQVVKVQVAGSVEYHFEQICEIREIYSLKDSRIEYLCENGVAYQERWLHTLTPEEIGTL